MGKRIVVFIVSVLMICLVFVSALAATDPTTPIDLELFSRDYPVSCFMAISEISVEHSNDAGCKALNKFVDTKNEKQHVTISSPIYDTKGDSSFSVRFRTKNEKTDKEAG